MSPPISKDWWLAAALSSAAVPAAVGQSAPNTQASAGVVSALNAPASTATGQPVAVGNDVQPGQRYTTGAKGSLHLLFADQSAVTLGPDSDLQIEVFRFDPATQQGEIRLKLNKGLLRVVGGKISKNQPTVVTTASGKVEISGGISVVENSGQNVNATFLFGQQMRVTNNGGNSQNVTRPGFGVNLNSNSVSQPQRTNTSQLNQLLSAGSTGPLRNGFPQSPPPPPSPTTVPYSPGLKFSLPDDRLTQRQAPGNPINNPTQTLRDILNSQTTQVS